MVQLPQERAEDHYFNYHHTCSTLEARLAGTLLPTCIRPLSLSHDGRLPEREVIDLSTFYMPIARAIAYSSIVSHYPRHAVAP